MQTIRDLMSAWQSWLCDRTDRGESVRRRLRIETEADGVTPRVHVVSLSVTDQSLHSDPWSAVGNAAAAAGITVWSRGEVWLLWPEMHIMQPDGRIVGGVALGAGGSGDEAGVAMVDSSRFSLVRRNGLTDTRPYAGMIIPEIGPYPLVQDVSFAWFEGTTLSSVTSSLYGAGLHELLHALGLLHDWRNDDNFHGNVMFNGLRGFRGAVFPALFPADETRLEYSAVLHLRTSRYMQLCDPAWPTPTGNDSTPPQIRVSTQGLVTPVNGMLEIAVTVQDDQALACIWLDRAGDRIDELELSGTTSNIVLRTPFHLVQTATEFGVTAVDRRGNLRRATTTITVAAVGNRAPTPRLKITPPAAPAGAPVTLDGSTSQDPENGSLLFEWDLNGDGTFDTPPSTNPVLVTSWDEPWTRLVHLRVTDPAGARAVSTPLPVRTEPAAISSDHAPYGEGTPGCLGLVHLRANHDPVVGTTAFGLATTHAPRAVAGVFGMSLNRAAACVPIGAACLLLDPATLVFTLPITADGRGNAWTPLPIPPNAALRGLALATQSLWPEPGGCQIQEPRLATSNGLFVRLR